jgi:hypothetical protein
MKPLAGENSRCDVERCIVDLDPLRPSGRDPAEATTAFKRFNNETKQPNER